jgi:hypothetical protein
LDIFATGVLAFECALIPHYKEPRSTAAIGDHAAKVDMHSMRELPLAVLL